MTWGTGWDALGCCRKTWSRVAVSSSLKAEFLEMAAAVGPLPAHQVLPSTVKMDQALSVELDLIAASIPDCATLIHS